MSRERHLNIHCFSHPPPRDHNRSLTEQSASSAPVQTEFNLRLFEQSELWMDFAGTTYRIEALDVDDRHELAEWLHRNAHYFYLRVLARDLASTLRVSPGTLPPIAMQLPGQWMATTPLLRALRGETGRDIR